MGGMMDFVMLGVMVLGGAFLWVNKDNLAGWFQGGGTGGCGCPSPQFCRIRDGSCYTPPICTGGKIDDGNGLCIADTGGNSGGSGNNVNCKDGHDCSTRCANGWCNSFKACCKGQSCAHCGVTGGTSGSNCSSLNCDTSNGFAKVKDSTGKCKCLCQRASCGTSGSKCNKGWAYNQSNNSCVCSRTSAGCSSSQVVICTVGGKASACTSSANCTCTGCKSGFHPVGNVCTKDAAPPPPPPTANCYGFTKCKGLTGGACCSCAAAQGGCKAPKPKGVICNTCPGGCTCSAYTQTYGASEPMARADYPGPYGDYRFANTGRVVERVRLAQ